MDHQELIQLLIAIPITLMFIGFVTGIVRYLRLGRAQKLLVLLVGLAILAETSSRILALSGFSSYPVFHIYILVEFSVLLLIYQSIFDRFLTKKRTTLILVSFWLLGLINVLFDQPLHLPNTNMTTLISAIWILVSILYFFWVLNRMKYAKIERSALFWISIGLLVYYGSTFVLFAFGGQLVPVSLRETFSVWVLNVFFNTLHYLCFNIALWMDPE